MAAKYVMEPFRIKMVEPIRLLSRQEREKAISRAHYNLFYLKSEDVAIDLLSDSGSNAMSSAQWAGMMLGDESYAGSSNYYRLMEVTTKLFGYDYVQPVHQGRAAEKVLFPLLLSEGKVAISNMFFDTTRAHVELAGGRAIDCVVPEARITQSRAPFKGNMDIERFKLLLEEYKGRIGVVVMTVTNNSAGGQPVSLENLRQVSELCKEHALPLSLDAARFAENAYFIKQREEEYKNRSIEEIVYEMFQLCDYFTMSAKKDAILNMGGLVGARVDGEMALSIKANTISFEGFSSYGGLAGRDLEAMAIGLLEGVQEDQLRYRIGQVEYLSALLEEAGIAHQTPAGGHGLFIDAKALLPHIPYYEFPGQALAVELYKEAGIRGCDVGSYMMGNDPDTRKQMEAEFEFTRLAIPRRVYTQSHLDLIAQALIEIKKRADRIKGYQIVWEPPILRHFQAHLVPVE